MAISDHDVFFLFGESAFDIEGFQELMESSLAMHPVRPELSSKHFQDLVEQLRQDKIQRLLATHKAAMTSTRVDKWLLFIEEHSRDSSVGLQITNYPLQTYLNEIDFLFGDLKLKSKARGPFLEELAKLKSSDSIYSLKFDLHRIKPNNFQLSVGLYIASNMNLVDFQLWPMPFGTGKSVIMALTVLIALQQF